jgi:calpain-15
MLNGGEMKEIIIDDHFLNNNSSNKPIFAKGVNDELWAMVLEKVYAKKYGSYSKIVAGQPSMALHDLTGAPYFIEEILVKIKMSYGTILLEI